MLRLRCQLVSNGTAKLQLERAVFSRRSFAFRPVGYGMSFSPSSTRNLFVTGATTSTSATATTTSTVFISSSNFTAFQRRFNATDASKDGAKEGEAKTETKGETDEKGEKKDGKEKKEGEEEEEPPKKNVITGFFGDLKADVALFPDIYNSANMINFVLFTIFCLCSTGSNVEEKWWMDNWGIDASFAPWAWPLHSVLMNNFMSMAFSMMIMHSMCHSVMPHIGSSGLFMYCAIIAVTSGFMMWAGNYAADYRTEKQFGPWDVAAGLFVMQYLHQGFTPFQILNGFNGWVKYACWVGAVCVLYYDWQPIVCGTGVGLALCKFHPRFRGVPVAAK